MVIMTNGDNGGRLASEIQRAVAKEYGWPDFAPEEHTVVEIDPKLLDAYVGAYEAPFGVFTVTRKGDQLFVALTDQPTLRLFPENGHDFFVTEVEASFTFETDAQGKATQLILHQNGQNVPAKRQP